MMQFCFYIFFLTCKTLITNQRQSITLLFLFTNVHDFLFTLVSNCNEHLLLTKENQTTQPQSAITANKLLEHTVLHI